jgi:hypothetical protein
MGHSIVPSRIAILSLAMILSSPLAFGSSPDEEVKLCSAGSILDTACIQKHRSRFEKYVIEDYDRYSAKWSVSSVLIKYYDQIREPDSEKVRTIRAKNTAFAEAHTISDNVTNSHSRPCQVGPDCENGVYFDVPFHDLEREQAMATKQYFVNLSATLYKGEIKYCDHMIKLYSQD